MQPSQMSTTYFMASEGCVQLEDLVNQRFTVGLPSLLDPGSTFLGNQVASPHTWEASMIFFFFLLFMAPPQIYMLKPSDQCDGIMKWNLWEEIRPWRN
jgi:hypothetical protein